MAHLAELFTQGVAMMTTGCRVSFSSTCDRDTLGPVSFLRKGAILNHKFNRWCDRFSAGFPERVL